MIREVWRLLVGRRCELCGERYRRARPDLHYWLEHAGDDVGAAVRGGLRDDPLAVGRLRAAERDRRRRLDAATADTRRVLLEVDECRRTHTGPPCWPGPCRRRPGATS